MSKQYFFYNTPIINYVTEFTYDYLILYILFYFIWQDASCEDTKLLIST